MGLDHLADRVEIEHLIAVYIEAIDNSDFDALDGVFTEDCLLDFTSAGGVRERWPEVKRWWQRRHHVYVHYLHIFTNPLITFESDTEAGAKWKVYNPCGVVGPEGDVHDWINVGHYTDRYLKTANGWRVWGRTWHHGWMVGDYPYSTPPGTLGTGAEV